MGRATVLAANDGRKTIMGFEEGRIFNGYRNVFPLEYEGEHVGTVEISFSPKAISSSLYKQISGYHQFVMSKSVVEDKVFSSEQSNYESWIWSEDYVLDTAASLASLFPNRDDLQGPAQLLHEIKTGLESRENFALPVWVGGESYALQLLAISNASGQHVAYWIFLQECPQLKQLKKHAYFSMGIFLFMTILSIVAIFWINNVERRMKEYESFLPICATCKKVRAVAAEPRDPASWITIEDYFTSRTDSTLTHGICPACYTAALEESEI